MFHIFQYLEEDDLLLIGQRKGEICDDRFHELCIERNCRRESFTLGDSFIFFLNTSELELEEFTVAEFLFCSLEGIDRFRKVDISYT